MTKRKRNTMTKEDRAEVRKAAKAVRVLKVLRPHIFPEFVELKSAELAMRDAKERLRYAKQRWEYLGSEASMNDPC
jgi:hypothetical protein